LENIVAFCGGWWLGLNENLQPHFGDALLAVTVIVAKSGQEKGNVSSII
jgi:hypothetical protein